MTKTPEHIPAIAKITRILLMFCALSAVPMTVHAAGVINLTEQDKQLEIRTGDGFVPVTIPAWRTVFFPGKVKVRFLEREVFIEHHEEYAIWPDNSFGPQRRYRHLKGM
jgi:hypothetical protein